MPLSATATPLGLIPAEIIWVFSGVLTVLIASTVVGRVLLTKTARRAARETSGPVMPVATLPGLTVSISTASRSSTSVVPLAPQRFAENWMARVNAWWWMVAVLAGVLLATALADATWPIAVFFALLSLLAMREYFSSAPLMAHAHPWMLLGFYILLPAQYLLWIYGQSLFALLLTPLYALSTIYGMSRRGSATAQRSGIRELATGVLVCVYGLSFPMALAVANGQGTGIRATLQLVFLLVISQASDVFQFIAGKLWGKRKIAARLSPHKTVEGLLGGLVGAAGLGATMWWLTPYSPIGAGLLALGIAILGFLGGLYLSAKKRARGIKDWGNVLPGHGGILDRVDSLWLSAPFCFVSMMF